MSTLHLRDLPASHFNGGRIPDEFRDFFSTMVLPRLGFRHYKLAAKRQVACECVHNLIANGLGGKTVVDSRSTSDAAIRQRAEVWDVIEQAELCKRCVGSETSGRRTRYLATDKLLELKRHWELGLLVDLRLKRNSATNPPTEFAPVVLKTKGKSKKMKVASLRKEFRRIAPRDSDGKPERQALRIYERQLINTEDLIEKINRELLSHTWQALGENPETGKLHAFQPNPCLRQIHSGAWRRATRLYSWSQLSGQSLSKQSRRKMLIDGETVLELDFRGHMTRMLYHVEGIDIQGDPYRPEEVMPVYAKLERPEAKVLRGFIKRATNICWNVASRGDANSSIGKRLADHEQADFLYQVLSREGIVVTDVADRIMSVHPELEHRFFSGVGVEMMTMDGDIMLEIMRQFVVVNRKPALAIHDAIVVRRSDVKLAIETMKNVYQRFLGFWPKVSTSGSLRKRRNRNS